MARSSSAGSFQNSQYQPPQQQFFFPPPTIPEAHSNRVSVSIGVINGEIDGSSAAQKHHDMHIPAAPLSAKLPMTAIYDTVSNPIPRTPGTAKEVDRIEELEAKARKYDANDLAIKLRVRLAKVILRSINCACSIVVLAMVASTFAIFFATRHLAPRNNLQPWAADTPQWPQIVTLVVACISLLLSLSIMYSYWRGGHKLAERAALRATVIAGILFVGMVIMWAVIIGIMQSSRANSNGHDIWDWACNDNTRRKLFADSVDYVLVCRQQDWVVVCAIIEISVEFLAIGVYMFGFYRIFVSKKRLRKSTMMRDDARSSLWLAQLRERGQLDDLENQHDETSKNTAYNTLCSRSQTVPEKNVVPILQAVPPAARRNHQQQQPQQMMQMQPMQPIQSTSPVSPLSQRTPSPPGTSGSNGSAGSAVSAGSYVPPVPPPPMLPAALAEMHGQAQRSPRVVSFAQAETYHAH